MVEVPSSLEAFHLMKHLFNPYAEEVWVLALNSKLKLQGTEMIFRGTVNSCPMHPRDIFRYLIGQNACAFILVHNHPSQDPQPSAQDLRMTAKLKKLSDMIEITMLDHIIIAHEKYFSFADALLLGGKTIGPRRRQTALG